MSQVGYVQPAIGYRTTAFRNPAKAALNGLGALGDDSSTMASLGFSPGQIQLILQKHADGSLSDNGYTFLLQGGVPTTDLDNFLNQDVGAPETGSAGTASAAAAAQPNAGVPTGSTITYQGQWQSNFSTSPADVVNKVAGLLSSLGLTLAGSQVSASLASTAGAAISLTGAPFSVVLSVRVSGPGFQFVTDAQANIDHAVYVVTGKMPTSSGAVVSGVPGAGGSGALPNPTLTQWFEQNATWLFLGIGALVLLPSLIGGRR